MTIEEMDFTKEKDVDMMFLNELKKLRASPNDALIVPKENAGISHGYSIEGKEYLIW